MKWFIVVLSLVTSNPDGDRDMWILQKVYNSVDRCVYEASVQSLGLIAKAHEEFNYRIVYPNIQPWDAWTVRCVNENELKEVIIEEQEELKI